MTRVSQWLKRRRKNIAIGRRMWNGRPRGGSGIPYHPATGEVQHNGHWSYAGTVPLKRPVLLKKTFRREMKALHHPYRVTLLPGVGKWSPPHYKSIDPPVTPTDSKSKYREGVNRAYFRNVLRRTHKATRLKGDDYKAYVAWVYWKKNGAWPPWDVKHRTPVDTRDRWADDDG